MAVLPVAPPPMPGELLASWVGRLACLYDAPPSGLWRELAGVVPAEFAWGEPDCGSTADHLDQVARVAAAARLDRRDLVATTTHAMLPAAPATWLRSATVSISRVPWCPACLRDDVVRHGVPYLRRFWAAGCVVVCRRHRAPLMDTCPACERLAFPTFRWITNRPMLACTTCGAILSESDGRQRPPDAARASAGACHRSSVPPAAVSGAGRLQATLLRVLRGHPPACPWAHDCAPQMIIPAIEGLIGDVACPLGIEREASWAITGRRESGLRCSPTGLPVRAAFAAMAAVAALLALPDAELDARSEGLLWRQHALGQPIDLARLWAAPNAGGAVLWCKRERLLDAVGSIGIAVALSVLGDPAVPAYLAARRLIVPGRRSQPPGPVPRVRADGTPPKPHPRPEADARFRRLAQRVLADPNNAARLTAASTPAARRRVLGRLAREALDAGPRQAMAA